MPHYKLDDPEYLLCYGWGKIISILKKQMDQWTIERLSNEGYKDFKVAYMRVIMNIDADGTNNNELATRAGITKQAMSKIVSDLQKKGYIASKTDTKDKRSTIFALTPRGKEFVKCARSNSNKQMDEYRKVFGKKNFNELVMKLVDVIKYNYKNSND